MLTFSQYLSETYKNFIGIESIENRRKWLDQTWDILQQSYKPLGGIRGSGFDTKENMLKKIPFWKLSIKDGVVKAAIFYKDKNGRKLVASATDGTAEGRRAIEQTLKASLGVTYGEKSGPALGLLMKTVEWDALEPFLMKPEKAQKILKKEVREVVPSELSPKDKKTYDKFPQLRPYFYVRNLEDGKPSIKVAFGTPFKKIR